MRTLNIEVFGNRGVRLRTNDAEEVEIEVITLDGRPVLDGDGSYELIVARIPKDRRNLIADFFRL